MTKNNFYIASFAILLMIGQISAQDHLWTFDENQGNIAYDSGSGYSSGSGNNGGYGGGHGGGRGRRGGNNNPNNNNNNNNNNYYNNANGYLNNADWLELSKVGPGAAVHISGTDDSYVDFGNAVGQFGTQDFTVAFWVQTTDTLNLYDLVGNRADPGHGNWFAVRMTDDGYVSAEVDQDAQGTNYIGMRSVDGGLNDGNWHHVAVTRASNNLYLYIDGTLSNSGSANGVANIYGNQSFRIGRSLNDGSTPRFAPDGVFDDLAIYYRALEDYEVQNLYENATNQ